MRSRSRATLSDDRPTVLIAALSGRALAAAAHRAGYVPLVADLFGDLDTRALAGATMRVQGSLAGGFSQAALLGALDRLAMNHSPVGLVCGGGFEGRPKLMRALAARYRVLGNAPETVARVKSPATLAALCSRLSIPHPRPSSVADGPGAWVRKRVGASGGGHVAPAEPGAVAGRGWYFQQRAEGTPISALFLADGRRGLLLGISRQWADPTPTRPFRYGGAIRPAPVPDARTAGIAEIVAALAPETGLVGLNSVDLLVRTDGLDLIEINPRPGATLDIFVDARGRLFQFHVDACLGILPDRVPTFPPAAAASIVYARRAMHVAAGMVWPDWAADRQPAGIVHDGAPLCTVLAEADDPGDAERLVRARAAAILSMIEERT
ncbi:MAG TPA: ATP-grasp domain-containing protein [Acetobacteraceae bacterium]